MENSYKFWVVWEGFFYIYLKKNFFCLFVNVYRKLIRGKMEKNGEKKHLDTNIYLKYSIIFMLCNLHVDEYFYGTKC